MKILKNKITDMCWFLFWRNMIKIKIEETGSHIHIEAIGHANYNVVGQDIVCSAISALLQTLCYSLEELTKDKVNISLKSGNSSVNIYKPSSKSRILVDSFFIGCTKIAGVYSDYVEVVMAGEC